MEGEKEGGREGEREREREREGEWWGKEERERRMCVWWAHVRQECMVEDVYIYVTPVCTVYTYMYYSAEVLVLVVVLLSYTCTSAQVVFS